ncbi:hypothetical protein P9112_009053 [Eukaryota sp. TZLM1-RC]
MPLWTRKRSTKDLHASESPSDVAQSPSGLMSSARSSPLRTSSAPIPINKLAESLEPSPPQDDAIEVLCRICEDYVPLCHLEDHSRYCSVVSRADMRISSCDERLDKIIAAINRRILNQRTCTSKSFSSSSSDQFFSQPLHGDAIFILEDLADVANQTRNLSDDFVTTIQLQQHKDHLLDRLRNLLSRAFTLHESPLLSSADIFEFDGRQRSSSITDGRRDSRTALTHFITRIERLVVEKFAAAESSSSASPNLSPNTSRSYLPSPLPRSETASPLKREMSSSPPMLCPPSMTSSFNNAHRSRPSSAGSSSSPHRLPSISDFEIVKPISRGAFGRVYLAVKKRTGDIYAIKILKKDDMVRKNQVHRVKTERNILTQTDCPFLIKCFWTFQSTRHLYIVMEYISGGDLYSLLNNVGTLPEVTAKHYVAELVLSLEYLHKHGIVHRDVKPDNLLVSEDGHIKLIDFGLSHFGVQRSRESDESHSDSNKSVSDTDSDIELDSTTLSQDFSQSLSFDAERPQRRYSCVGTPEYLAPEVLIGRGHDCMIDWWSVGVLTFELIAGVPPFEGESKEQLFEAILSCHIQWPADVTFSNNAKDFITKLLQLDPKNRLGYDSIDEIKQHPFLREINWDTVLTERGPFIPVLTEQFDTSYFDSRSPPPEANQFDSPKSPLFDSTLDGHPFSPPGDDPAFEGFSYKNVYHLEQMNMQLSSEYRRRSSFVVPED